MKKVVFVALLLISISVFAQQKFESFDKITSPLLKIPNCTGAPSPSTSMLYAIGNSLFFGTNRLDTSSHSWTNVKDYGAKGDGVTNDTRSFQNAIVSRKPLLIPEGVYIIDSLVFSHGTTLIGMGGAKSRLVLPSGKRVLIKIRDMDTAYISGLYLSGGAELGSYNLSSVVGNRIGIELDNSNYVTIRDCEINGFSKCGLQLHYNMRTTLDKVNFYYNYCGIDVQDGSEYQSHNSMVLKFNKYALKLTGGNNALTNIISMQNVFGVYLYYSPNAAHGSITNSSFNHNTYAAYIDSVQPGQLFSACNFFGGGFRIKDSWDISLTGCRVSVDSVRFSGNCWRSGFINCTLGLPVIPYIRNNSTDLSVCHGNYFIGGSLSQNETVNDPYENYDIIRSLKLGVGTQAYSAGHGYLRVNSTDSASARFYGYSHVGSSAFFGSGSLKVGGATSYYGLIDYNASDGGFTIRNAYTDHPSSIKFDIGVNTIFKILKDSVTINRPIYVKSSAIITGKTTIGDTATISNEFLTADKKFISTIAGTTRQVMINAYQTNPTFACRRYGGTYLTPLAIASGNNIGSINVGGCVHSDGTIAGYNAFKAFTSETWTKTANGFYFAFSTVPIGTVAVAERVRFQDDGKIGIGTTAPTALLDVSSDVIRLRTSKTPASATAAGNAGDFCFDANYFYYCYATNSWKRSALTTWP